MNWPALTVFIALFLFVTGLGFWAARWRAGDLTLLHEWGLGGRRFGTFVTWVPAGRRSLHSLYVYRCSCLDLWRRRAWVPSRCRIRS